MKYTYEIISDENGKFALIRKHKSFFGKVKIEFHYDNQASGPWWVTDPSAHAWVCWRESKEKLEAFKKRYELAQGD